MHRAARNDARRLDVDAAAFGGDDRSLAVDRVAERVDDAAEQALADRHVDDGAGALDRLAFLDLAVLAEDHDADIVDFEVQRHAADAVFELDHLAGLDIVEPVGARDAVADRQHLPDLGDFRLLAEALDLLLEDCGNFSGADVHQPTSFITCLSAFEFGAQRRIEHAAAEFHDQPAEQRGFHRHVDGDVLAGHAVQRILQCGAVALRQRLGDAHLGANLAAVLGEAGAEGAQDLFDREQPTVGGDAIQETRGESADAGLGENGVERAALRLGTEHRALHQALQIGAVAEQLFEAVEVGGKRRRARRLPGRVRTGPSRSDRPCRRRSVLRGSQRVSGGYRKVRTTPGSAPQAPLFQGKTDERWGSYPTFAVRLTRLRKPCNTPPFGNRGGVIADPRIGHTATREQRLLRQPFPLLRPSACRPLPAGRSSRRYSARHRRICPPLRRGGGGKPCPCRAARRIRARM